NFVGAAIETGAGKTIAWRSRQILFLRRTRRGQRDANHRGQIERLVAPIFFLQTPAGRFFAGFVATVFPIVKTLGVEEVIAGKITEHDFAGLMPDRVILKDV